MTLSVETQRLIQERMKKGGYPTVDHLVQAAIGALDEFDAQPLDEAALDAIDRAESQIERGEDRDWEGVKAELRRKFLDK